MPIKGTEPDDRQRTLVFRFRCLRFALEDAMCDEQRRLRQQEDYAWDAYKEFKQFGCEEEITKLVDHANSITSRVREHVCRCSLCRS